MVQVLLQQLEQQQMCNSRAAALRSCAELGANSSSSAGSQCFPAIPKALQRLHERLGAHRELIGIDTLGLAHNTISAQLAALL